jgi:hypothetical protein
MKKRIKALVVTLVVMFTLALAAPAFADTVYYKGTAVSWDYGRTLVVYSYSDVQSSYYEHLCKFRRSGNVVPI